jgi:release factor glutamine methyltransferase
MLSRRETGEPLAWITGRTWFCGTRVRVDPGVYVPRPHTEALARRAAALLPSGGRAVDLCSGSGAIARHLAARAPGAVVVGVDEDRSAVLCARRNGIPAVQSDVDAPLRAGSFDVVTAVPPYVPDGAIGLLPADVRRWEPHRALAGGADGLGVARRVVRAAARLLRPGGWLLVEVGGRQDVGLAPDLDRHGFAQVVAMHDADGDLRAVVACRDG